MKDENPYWKELTPEEVEMGFHRKRIGGMWDEVGRLQFEFLCQQGLQPHHNLLDVGCGSLRGGVHFIPYLSAGNYYGIDINASLIEAGKMELAKVNAADKNPHLLVDDRFRFFTFKTQFDFALALSVFTHLNLNHIQRCLVEIKKVLKEQGTFYATFFPAPQSAYLPNIVHQPGGATTRYDLDPYHYSFDEIQFLSKNAKLTVELMEEFSHPRAQKMLRFKHEL